MNNIIILQRVRCLNVKFWYFGEVYNVEILTFHSNFLSGICLKKNEKWSVKIATNVTANVNKLMGEMSE